MSDNGSNFLARSIGGFVFSPLFPSVLYAWFSWRDAFFPMVYFVIFVAYLLALIVLLPVYLVIIRKHLFNVYSSSFLSFAVLFVLFSLFFMAMGTGYTSLTAGSKVLVDEGSMTAAGYARAFYGAFIVGLYGMLGGFIFSIFIRGRKLFKLSCI